MRHIEEISITFKGLAPRPETFFVPANIGRELLAYIEAKQDKDWIPAQEVLPELANDVQRPATVLRGLRHRQNMTQKQLADKLDIHQHHLSEMEHGKRLIGKEMAKKLATALKADWRVFL